MCAASCSGRALLLCPACWRAAVSRRSSSPGNQPRWMAAGELQRSGVASRRCARPASTLPSSARPQSLRSAGRCGRSHKLRAACCSTRPGSGVVRGGPGALQPKHRQYAGGGRREAMRGILAVLAGWGIGPGLVLLVGSQFGAGGSDSLLLVPGAARMIAVSVGAEPGGVPAGVVHAGGGSRASAAPAG